MWIRRKGCESVNIDYVQSIEKIDDREKSEYAISFYQLHKNEVYFAFDTKTELDEYYEALMFQLSAIEIIPVKL